MGVLENLKFRVIMNKVALNICVMCLCGHTLVYLFLLGKYQGVGWLGFKRVCNFIRNCQTVFQSDCTTLYSCQQYIRLQLLQYPYQHCYREL